MVLRSGARRKPPGFAMRMLIPGIAERTRRDWRKTVTASQGIALLIVASLAGLMRTATP